MDNLPHPKPKRNYKKHSVIGGLTGLLFTALYFFISPSGLRQLQAIPSPGSAYVVQAVDGDTLDIRINGHSDTVRLIGVDTPETHDPRKAVQCFGKAAAIHTKTLAEGKTVRLEADSQDSNRDKYHRLLRYVYLPDGTMLNSELIQDGYGFAYTVFPFTKLEAFRQLESQARASGHGLWSGCQIDASSAIKQTQSQ